MNSMKFGVIALLIGFVASYVSWGYGYTRIPVHPETAWSDMWMALVLMYLLVGICFGAYAGWVKKFQYVFVSYFGLLALCPFLISIHTVYWLIPVTLAVSIWFSYYGIVRLRTKKLA